MVYTLPKATFLGFALPTTLATTTAADASLTFNSTTGEVGKGGLGAGDWIADQNGGGFSLFNIAKVNYEDAVGGTDQKIIIGGSDTINDGSGDTTSIVIGHGATVNDVEQVCIGQGAVCSAQKSVCIGRNALVDTACDNSVAIGRNATNYAIRGCVVGTGATTVNATEDVTAIGYGSAAQANKSVAIGVSATVSLLGGESVSIGYNTFSRAYGSIVIGSNANCSEDAVDAVSIGRGANVNPSTGGIAIGVGSGSGSENGIAIGRLATAFGGTTGQVAIGYLANAGGDTTNYALFLTPSLPNTNTPSHMLSFNSTSGQVGRSILPQHVYTASATNVQIATNIPVDDSVPQNTEGTELTAIASTITPKSASSTLRITVRVPFTILTADLVVCSLFRDSTANALATSSAGAVLNTGMCMFVHEVTSGSTASTTFKVRLGTSLGGTAHIPTSLVAGAGTEYFGQTLKYTMTIDEII